MQFFYKFRLNFRARALLRALKGNLLLISEFFLIVRTHLARCELKRNDYRWCVKRRAGKDRLPSQPSVPRKPSAVELWTRRFCTALKLHFRSFEFSAHKYNKSLSRLYFFNLLQFEGWIGVRDWSMKSWDVCATMQGVFAAAEEPQYQKTPQFMTDLLFALERLHHQINFQARSHGQNFTSLRHFLYSVSSLNTEDSFFLCTFTTASKSETRAARFTAASSPRELSFPARLSMTDW